MVAGDGRELVLPRPQRGRRGAQAASGCCSSTPTACPAPDLLDRYFDPPPGERCGAVARRDRRRSPTRTRCSPATRATATSSHQSEGMHAKAGAAARDRQPARAPGGLRGARRLRRGHPLRRRRRPLLAPAATRLVARVAARRRWSSTATATTWPTSWRRSRATAPARAGSTSATPGSAPRWPLVAGLIGSARDVGGHLARGRVEPAAFRAIDGLGLVAHNVGYRASNDGAERARRARTCGTAGTPAASS